MELLNTIQSILPFGVLTLSVLTLLGVALLAALVLWVGQQFIKLAINADHDKSPDYEFLKGNVVLSKLKSLLAKADYESCLAKFKTGWAVRAFFIFGWEYYDRTDSDTWDSNRTINAYCTYNTKEEALDVAKKKCVALAYIFTPVYVSGYLLTLDILLWLLPQYFLPTIIILSVGGLLWTTRTIAGKVYENTDNIGVHEDKITDLETKINK